jgi:hypothetical protein
MPLCNPDQGLRGPFLIMLLLLLCTAAAAAAGTAMPLLLSAGVFGVTACCLVPMINMEVTHTQT